MKKVFGILALLSFAFALNAAAPSAPTLYGPTQWECVYGWNVNAESAPSMGLAYQPSTARDSLDGADSITLLNKFPLESGWDYLIQMKDSCGTADSFYVYVYTYGSDKSTLMSRTNIDSVYSTQTFKMVGLVPSTTGYTNLITLKAIKAVATLKAKIRRFELVRRRAATNKLF